MPGAHGVAIGMLFRDPPQPRDDRKDQKERRQTQPEKPKADRRPKNTKNAKDLANSWDGESLCPNVYHK